MSEDPMLPALGMTFAAFWIWLIVRIINRREEWAITFAVFSAIVTGLVAIFVKALLDAGNC
jgi:hypothetical protein